MIRSRLLRLGAVVFGTVGMLAMPAPSAQADEVGEIVLTGNAVLNGPLGYPCNPTTPATPPKACPPAVTLENKDGLKNTTKTNVNPGGNRRSFAFAPGTCTYAYATVGKTNKAPAATGTCSIAATGTVTGYCGLSLIKGTATINAGNQTYTITFWGQSAGPGLIELKFEGTKRTNNVGPSREVQGALAGGAYPVPGTGGPPPTTLDNSCGNKTADNFTIAAAATYRVKTTTTVP